MVILVMALASHQVSQPLVRIIEQEGIKFAIGSLLSRRSQLAQALYRVEHRLQSLPSNQVIDYPILDDK